MGLSIP